MQVAWLIVIALVVILLFPIAATVITARASRITRDTAADAYGVWDSHVNAPLHEPFLYARAPPAIIPPAESLFSAPQAIPIGYRAAVHEISCGPRTVPLNVSQAAAAHAQKEVSVIS